MGDQLVVAVMVLVTVQVFLFWGIAKRLDRHDEIQARMNRELRYLSLDQASRMRSENWVYGAVSVSRPIAKFLVAEFRGKEDDDKILACGEKGA